MWSTIVPVRGWQRGKSRLGLPGLARAMTLDTLEAIAGCAAVTEVIVVSPDVHVHADLAHLRVIAEPAGAGLNGAITHAAGHRMNPGCIVALGDLPCLQPHDLALVLDRTMQTSFVCDAEGVGTTIWLTPHGDVATHFGSRSRARHVAAGARELGAQPGDDGTAWARLRRDVDDDVDLTDAIRLGVGRNTRAQLRAP